MAQSLLFHPQVAAALWRAWFETGLQPIRRGFDLPSISVEGRRIALRCEERPLSPFASLTVFTRADRPPARRILLIPPLSGAFAFALRDMVESLAPQARVAVLEWTNARFVSSAAGPFLVDDQVAQILTALKNLGPGAHMAAVCQAGPPSLTAAALAAEAPDLSAPASLALIASPIAPHEAPSAMSRQFRPTSLGVLQSSMVWRETPDGGLRRVLPAESHFQRLTAALAGQRPGEHEFSTMLRDCIESRAPDAPPDFSDFVMAYMDAPAEHVLDNLTRLYYWRRRPLAVERWRRRRVDLRRLDLTPMMVVEGAHDTVVAPGQCRAALSLSPGAAGAPRREHLSAEAGHFGLFIGDVWRGEISAALNEAMAAAEEWWETAPRLEAPPPAPPPKPAATAEADALASG
ncbi:MAG: hypothetical protein AAGM38_12035 [Pseudomonadota bacterium]